MGDRFYLELRCAYCGKGSSVYYAPTCEFFDFRCRTADLDSGGRVENVADGCGRVSFVAADFSVKRVEDVVVEDVRQAIEMSSTASHTAASLRRWAASSYRALVKRAGLADAR